MKQNTLWQNNKVETTQKNRFYIGTNLRLMVILYAPSSTDFYLTLFFCCSKDCLPYLEQSE